MSDQLLRIDRNDIESVLKIRKIEKRTGEWTADSEEMAIMLQDDPDKLLDAFKEQDKAMAKALPRLSSEQREANAKPAASRPLKAGSKKLGSGGKVRYNYPGEKGGDKKPETPIGMQTGGKYDVPTKGNDKEEEQELPEEREAFNEDEPRTDIPPPEPDQDPIQVPNEKQQQEGAKHTVDINELLQALGMSREQLMQLVQRFENEPKLGGRSGFQTFMQTHAKEFADEHGLDSDYFGLVFDVLTGKIQEGQPTQPQPQQGK